MGTRAWTALALLLAGVLGAKIGVAADLSVVPSVNLKSEYNSNINFSTTNRVNDYIFTLQPSAQFNYTTEVGQLQGVLGLNGRHFITQSQLDHIDQNYQINGRYAATSRLSFLMNSAYIVDTTMMQELSTSGVVIGQTPRQSIVMNPGFSYALTERLMATLTYNFNQVNYSSPQLQNYTTQQVNLRLDYPLKNQKTTLIGNVVGGQTVYPANNSFRTLGTYLGMNHKFSEKWEATLVGGINYTMLDFGTQVLNFSQFPFFVFVQTKRQKTSEVTPYISLFTTRRWTNTSFTAGYSRDESPSAQGGVSQVNRINLFLSHDFTERWVGALYGDYYRSDLSQPNSSTDEVYQISPQVTYRLTEQLSLTPAYRFGYRIEQFSGGGSGTANRHNVWLFLTYVYPIHYQR